jgi:multiple sugar transport system ATP-binding protein
MARVVLEDVVKSYGSVLAVNNVSLTIDDGEFVALVGPSGCGKTTTLNLVAGLIPMTSGDIHIGDRLVNDLDPADRHRHVVCRTTRFYPQKSVYKNLAFPLQMRRPPRAEIETKVSGRSEGARHRICSNAGRANYPAVSSSAWRSDGRWSAILRLSADEPFHPDASCACRCAPSSSFHQDLNATVIYVTHDSSRPSPCPTRWPS